MKKNKHSSPGKYFVRERCLSVASLATEAKCLPGELYSRCNSSRGYTLIELVMSIAIIAIAVLGTLIAINTAALYSGDPMITYQGYAIAESYVEEIIQKSFPAGACPVATRPNYTNICNYNGLSQVPTDQTGTAIAGLGGYTVNVVVNSTTAQLGSPSLTAGTQVVRIDVSVSHNRMPTITFSTYRTNY